ncbi:polysaccharide biosynthesis tyrosine autokinase [Planctomycetota bacterium]
MKQQESDIRANTPKRGLTRWEKVWLVLTVLCTIVVLVATHLPPQYVPKVLSGNINDKVAHAIAYGAITLCYLLAFRKRHDWRVFVIFFCAITIIAIIDEITQPLVERIASPLDIVGDLSGVIAVFTVFSILSWISKSWHRDLADPEIPTPVDTGKASQPTQTPPKDSFQRRPVSIPATANTGDRTCNTWRPPMHTDTHAPQTGSSGYPPDAAYPAVIAADFVGEGPLEIIWQGRWWLVLCIILGVGVAYYIKQQLTPQYTSSAYILVEKPESQVVGNTVQAVGSTSDKYLKTQASMITSRQIIATALRDPNLLSLTTFEDKNDIAELVDSLSAFAGKENDIVEVSATSPYPLDAAQMVNSVVRAYSTWHQANRKLSTADLLKQLNDQFASNREELRLKRRERLLYEQRYPEVVENSEGNLGAESLDSLKTQLVEARLELIQREAHYKRVQQLVDEPETLREFVRDGGVSDYFDPHERERSSLWNELLKTRLQIQSLEGERIVLRSSEAVLQGRQQELEAGIARLDKVFVEKHLTLAEAKAEDARTHVDKLTTMYEKEFATVQGIPSQHPEYAFIISECDMLEKLCDTILEQINDLDLNARFEGLKIHVLEEAVAEEDPSFPQTAQVLGLGLMLGLATGTALTFLRNKIDQRLRSANEITAIIGAPILGSVPSIPKKYVSNNGHRPRPMMHPQASEAYRALRTALLYGSSPERATVVLVTSPGARAGKSTLVSNLGVALAQAGQRTLIVDADLRKPDQHRIFGVDVKKPGLTDVLASKVILKEVIYSSDTPGLDVLPGGSLVSNPTELLSSQTFADILAKLKQDYDRILIDSPPVGVVTDAQILATQCGLTLLVLRANKSLRPLTQQASEALYMVGAEVVGAVVNDVPRKDKHYRYGSVVKDTYGSYGSRGNGRPVKEDPEAAKLSAHLLPQVIGVQGNNPSQPRPASDIDEIKTDNPRASQSDSLPL